MEYEENDNQNSWRSNFLFTSFVIIISYVLLSFYSDQGTDFPFIIDLYYHILDTIANNIIFIFDYIPIHILNIILISFPEPPSTFLHNYKTHISGPFSRLFPKVYNSLTSIFPIFEITANMLEDYSKIKVKIGLWAIENQKLYSVIINSLIGLILFLNLNDLSNAIRSLFKRRMIKIWFTLFAAFLVCEKWVEIKGPDYLIFDIKLKQIEEYHLITLQKITDLFKVNKNDSNNIFSNIIKKGKDIFDIIIPKNDNFDKSIQNLDERLSAFYYSLIQKNNNILIYKIKMIHPQPFDTLFIYFIFAFIWSLLISFIISIINSIIYEDKNNFY